MEHDNDLFFDDRKEQEILASPASFWFNLCDHDLKIALEGQGPSASLVVEMTKWKRETTFTRLALQDGTNVSMRVVPYYTEMTIMEDALDTVLKDIIKKNTTKPVYIFLPEWFRSCSVRFSVPPSIIILYVPKKYTSANDLIEELYA